MLHRHFTKQRIDMLHTITCLNSRNKIFELHESTNNL